MTRETIPAASYIKRMASAFNLREFPQGWQPIPQRMPSTLTDSNTSTAQTVRRMSELVREALADPKIWECAKRVLRYEGLLGALGIPAAPGAETASAVFWWIKHHVQFLSDEQSVMALYGETDQVDFLVSPSVLLRMNKPAEDCDGQTMLACVLLCVLLGVRGVDAEIVTVQADRMRPGEWSHVYPRAVLPGGQRIVIDTTNGPWPGWEVPGYDVQAKQVWDLNGNPIGDSTPYIKDTRMHGYVRGGRRGIGDTSYTDLSAQASALTPTDYSTLDSAIGADLLAGTPGIVPSTSSTSSLNLNQLLNTLASAGTQLGKMALLPSGSSLLPSGAVISPSGAATGLLTTGTVGGLSLSGVMIIALLGFGFIMLVGRK